MAKSLQREISSVLNRACRENESNTPDFILAKYLLRCLQTGEKLINERESYYGVKVNSSNCKSLRLFIGDKNV